MNTRETDTDRDRLAITLRLFQRDSAGSGSGDHALRCRWCPRPTLCLPSSCQGTGRSAPDGGAPFVNLGLVVVAGDQFATMLLDGVASPDAAGLVSDLSFDVDLRECSMGRIATLADERSYRN